VFPRAATAKATARWSRLPLPSLGRPGLSAFDLIHVSHFLACPSNSPSILQSFTRHRPHKHSPASSAVFHFSSVRDSGLRFQVLRASALRAYLHACLHIRDWAIVTLPVRLTNITHACLGRTPSLPQSCPAQRMTSRSAKVRHVRVSLSFASVTQLFSQLSVCFLTKSRASGDLVKILFPASPRPELLARLHRPDPPSSLTTFSALCNLFKYFINHILFCHPTSPPQLTHPQPSRARPSPKLSTRPWIRKLPPATVPPNLASAWPLALPTTTWTSTSPRPMAHQQMESERLP